MQDRLSHTDQETFMSIKSKIATAAIAIGGLGVFLPVAAANAATPPIPVASPIVAAVPSTVQNSINTGLQAGVNGYETGIQAGLNGYQTGLQAALGGWQAGAQAAQSGWQAGASAAQAGLSAGATALGIPVTGGIGAQL
jgi:hypothetical protein